MPAGHLLINKSEITVRQSVQTKINPQISYYIISEVVKNGMIKIIEVRCTLNISNYLNAYI